MPKTATSPYVHGRYVGWRQAAIYDLFPAHEAVRLGILAEQYGARRATVLAGIEKLMLAGLVRKVQHGMYERTEVTDEHV